MNDRSLYEKIISQENLSRALTYACNERVKNPFFDPLEIAWYEKNRDEVLASLREVLKVPAKYRQGESFAYFPPKTNLCFRRMVFIPMHDLIVRYALVSVIADDLDSRMNPRSFSHRRADGDLKKRFFLKNYSASSWPAFVKWQKDSAARHKYMLKTDIASFYDSVSHKYLISKVCRALGLDRNGDVITLMKQLLRVNVGAYSHYDNSVAKPAIMGQGLAIGNDPDSYLANIYLMDIDDKMNIEGVVFGRYADDIRIFSDDLVQMKKAIIVLQESLLKLGLNLNASKTRLASSDGEKDAMRSKITDVYDYLEPHAAGEANYLMELIDLDFSDAPREFEPDCKFKNDSDAKDFCKYIAASVSVKGKIKKTGFIKEWHVAKLGQILREFGGASKHAAWLLAMTAFYDKVKEKPAREALALFEPLLLDKEVSTYAKYRLVHYLISCSDREGNLWIDLLHESWVPWFEKLFVGFLAEPAIELNLVAIRGLKVLGNSQEEIKTLAGVHCLKPLPGVVNAVLRSLEVPDEYYETQKVKATADEYPEMSEYF